MWVRALLPISKKTRVKPKTGGRIVAQYLLAADETCLRYEQVNIDPKRVDSNWHASPFHGSSSYVKVGVSSSWHLSPFIPFCFPSKSIAYEAGSLRSDPVYNHRMIALNCILIVLVFPTLTDSQFDYSDTFCVRIITS
jgi:hypothetical protein